MAFAEDMADFFDDDEFSDIAIYTPDGLNPVADVQVMVDRDIQVVDEQGVISVQTHITLHDRTLYTGPGDQIQIGSTAYAVHRRLEDDGTVQRLLVSVDWSG